MIIIAAGAPRATPRRHGEGDAFFVVRDVLVVIVSIMIRMFVAQINDYWFVVVVFTAREKPALLRRGSEGTGGVRKCLVFCLGFRA